MGLARAATMSCTFSSWGASVSSSSRRSVDQEWNLGQGIYDKQAWQRSAAAEHLHVITWAAGSIHVCQFVNHSQPAHHPHLEMEAITLRLEAIASRLEAIALRLEAIASRLEAMALRLEAIARLLDVFCS